MTLCLSNQAWTLVSSSENEARILLADYIGAIRLLHVKFGADGQEGSANKSASLPQITLRALGTSSIPSSLTLLADDLLFVGSSFGDSHLLRLLSEAQEDNKEYFEVVDTYTNIAPIVVSVLAGLRFFAFIRGRLSECMHLN